MSTRTPAAVNLAAEVRAVEEGHRAVLHGDDRGPYIRVVSDTVPGKAFHVRAHTAASGAAVFTCTPTGAKAFVDDHGERTGRPGVTACKHAALAARRLEREGIVELVAGVWRGVAR